MSNFEVRAKDGLARGGRFTTKHGTVKTPLLMPVVHPGKSTIRPTELVSDFRFQMIITNSYIINSHDRFRKKALGEGVHSLLEFDGPVMTDSGTFQMYLHGLPDGEIDPLEIVRFQREIGSDIGTILDAFSDPKVGRSKVEEDVKISLERARLSQNEKGGMLLAGTVQGGIYPDLREASAKALASMDFDIHPIGGLVPLMESYRYADIVRAAIAAKQHLPLDRPVHLFGCGHPMFFAQAAFLGCDFFDSASYAKFAESDRMLLPSGTVHLENLSELPCECPVCASTNADELKDAEQDDRALLLMKHNLYVSAAEMRRVRQAIQEGKLFELTANRARGHPALQEALDAMLELYDQLNVVGPVGKSASIFQTGPETAKRPEIIGFHRRLMARYPYRKTHTVLLVPHLGDRPFSDTTISVSDLVKGTDPERLIVVYVTPMGAIPWELEHVHPAQQCVFSRTVDSPTLDASTKRQLEFLHTLSYEEAIWLTRDTPTNALHDILGREINIETVEGTDELGVSSSDHAQSDSWPMRKVRALLGHQWGIEPKALAKMEDFEITFSKTTGKIRHVRKGEEIVFTLVPNTGLLIPTYVGGLELLKLGISPDYIVTMDSSIAEFVAKGKSALAKFVKHASQSIIAGEEVLIVDEDSNLLGVGRAVLDGKEMLAFKRGAAVATRHSREL
ncbi:MAG: tRNA guanosine(15) transglycosylase TgtA [Candidatus Thorarchaeota archaeon SMTZ1-83]